MHITTIANDTGRTLKICASEQLDIQQHGEFTDAALVASYAVIDDIEIDLQDTRIVRDSGLALLLMLRRKCGLLGRRIRLINCPEELQARLARHNLGTDFQIV